MGFGAYLVGVAFWMFIGAVATGCNRGTQLVRRLTRDPHLADDIAQQTFVHAWQSIRNLKSPSAAGVWLRKLAVNFWLQTVRGRKPEVPLDEDLRAASPITAAMQQLDLDAALAQLAP
jgi:DNA-directed RNA polymerase specialized sigma24 family protein